MIEQARSFVIDQVDEPALKHPALDNSIKNKVRHTKQFVERFKKVGDLYAYLKRFTTTPQGTEKVYTEFKQLGLLTYEDILPKFEKRYQDFLSDASTTKDFELNSIYTSWDLAIVSQTNDLQRGIYLLRNGEQITSILVKATLKEGKYPNRWLQEPDLLKYYLKRFKETFSADYIDNKAVIESGETPILVFTKQGTELTFRGNFEYVDHTTEPDGSMWFELRRPGAALTAPASKNGTKKGLVYVSNPKNLILYGPPGTGKTHEVIRRAVACVSPESYARVKDLPNAEEEVVKLYRQFAERGNIAFTTFHQSFSYEDFVEGLRMDEEGKFRVEKGVFRSICWNAENALSQKAASNNISNNKTFWKISLGNSDKDGNEIYDYCIKNNCIATGYGALLDYSGCNTKTEIDDLNAKHAPATTNPTDAEFLNRFMNLIKPGDIVLVSRGKSHFRAVGVVRDSYFFDGEASVRYKQFREVDWIYFGREIEAGKLLSRELSHQSLYKIDNNILDIDRLRAWVDESTSQDLNTNFVIVIDEINRGNVSKVFGELITLIEDDKRIGQVNEIRVTLPYSKEKFGVPNNLYILGTMNTADRSIALMDTALRRRFQFVEISPNPNLLTVVANIDLPKFLDALNNKIEYLFDRDHTIGHAYFMGVSSFDGLVSLMKHKVIPLLQEYFYDDWEKVELVLGGAGKLGDNTYFLSKSEVGTGLIASNIPYAGKRYRYTVVAGPTIQAFRRVYGDVDNA